MIVAGVGAPLYLRSVERDLEARVPAELAGLGFDGVRAEFRGQDGMLLCDTPLIDPEHALDLAHEVTGVVHVALDRSCRVSTVGTVTDDPEPATPEPDVATDPPSTLEPDLDPGFATVAELVTSESRLALFAALVEEAGLVGQLGVPDRTLTVFAPTQAAFDDLPADVVAELRTRPELLLTVVRNHLVEVIVDEAELAQLAAGDPGEMVSAAGERLAVGLRDGLPTVGDGQVIDPDLWADNGVVHVIDHLLLPVDLDLRALEGMPELVTVLRDGALELFGSVATGGDRLRLVAAAVRERATGNVDHEVIVDPDTTTTAETVTIMVDLIGMLPTALTTGSVGYDGTVFVRGVAVDADRRDALIDAAGPDAVVELSLRPVARPDDVDALNAELAATLAERPLRFAPGTSELDDAAAATLDLLAALVLRYAGTLVTIEGHTDTAGDPEVNLELSELRAGVVMLELADRGVPVEQLETIGRGGDDPILTDGVEDRVASRRVEMVVSITP